MYARCTFHHIAG